MNADSNAGPLQSDGGGQEDLGGSELSAAGRDQRADERDAALDARDAAAATREATQTGREQQNRHLLADAEERDKEADSRDLVAAERDEAISRDAFVSERGDYDAALKARRSAALDRLNSKGDRTSSALDRATLTAADHAAAEDLHP